MALTFRTHEIELYCVNSYDKTQKWVFEAFEGDGPNTTVCSGEGYDSYELAERAAYRELDKMFGNRWIDVFAQN